MKKGLVVLFFVSVSVSAYAGIPVWLNIESGVKGAVGGDLWVAADNSPSNSNNPFTETTGGFAGEVGPFVELRFIKFIALDMEFLFGWDQIKAKDTIGGIDYKYSAKSFNFKLPILLKGVLPLPGVKLSLGTGPILEFPISGNDIVQSNTKYKEKTKFSVLWAAEIGIDVKLNKHFRLPFNLRASYNLSQPSSYNDRINNGSMTYQNTWEFRLLLGVAYEL